jgi:hypothetical protein
MYVVGTRTWHKQYQLRVVPAGNFMVVGKVVHPSEYVDEYQAK